MTTTKLLTYGDRVALEINNALVYGTIRGGLGDHSRVLLDTRLPNGDIVVNVPDDEIISID